jgi:hypothetical protein
MQVSRTVVARALAAEKWKRITVDSVDEQAANRSRPQEGSR